MEAQAQSDGAAAVDSGCRGDALLPIRRYSIPDLLFSRVGTEAAALVVAVVAQRRAADTT